jgi:hypothetical protein
LQKLVEIKLGKHIYPEFPRISCQKKRKFAPKKEQCSPVVVAFLKKKGLIEVIPCKVFLRENALSK